MIELGCAQELYQNALTRHAMLDSIVDDGRHVGFTVWEAAYEAVYNSSHSAEDIFLSVSGEFLGGPVELNYFAPLVPEDFEDDRDFLKHAAAVILEKAILAKNPQIAQIDELRLGRFAA